MTMTTSPDAIEAITSPEAEHLTRTELGRGTAQLRELGPDDWSAPTACTQWDVRALAGHMLGQIVDFSSFPRMGRRMFRSKLAARRTGGALVDCMTAGQVADHASLNTGELLARMDAGAHRAARWRAGVLGAIRRRTIEEIVGGVPEPWTIGYLLDLILLRDAWMHRVDVAVATGAPLELTPDHDGRIIADVVAEWARRHGQPFELTLTGPAGGHFGRGPGGEHIEVDAIDYCLALSGRRPGDGLLGQPVPF